MYINYNDILNSFECEKKLNLEEKSKNDIYISNKKESKNICKKCKNQELNLFNKDLKNGYIICKKCGLVQELIVNNNPEWRWYGLNDSKYLNPTRCGIPINPLLPKSSMGTFIGGNRYGNLQRLHSWNAMPSDERSLWTVFQSINQNTKNSGLVNKIIEQAKLYYKILSEKSKNKKNNETLLTRGIIRKGIISACIFVACKNNNVPRLASEIADMCDIKTSDVTRGLKKFVEIEMKKNLNININITSCNDFIERYCNKLDINSNYKKLIQFLATRAKKLSIVNDNTPQSIATGVIYLVNILYNLKIYKTKIKEKLKISDVTVSKCYKKLLAKKSILFIGLFK